MNQNGSARVNWGLEVLRVLGIIAKVLLRIFSYFLNIILTVLLIGLITGIIVGTVFIIYINNYLDLEIDPNTIVAVNRDSLTRIYYMDYETEEDRINRNGTEVEIEDQRLYGGDSTIAVSYSQLPENLINAYIAIEDHRFMEHNGVDWITTGKAVFKFFFGGDGGGSTITQQLIKNITGENEVTIQRKVEEIFRAINLEKVKSKEEILEAYMNIIYLGNNCYGVQAASNFYFGKDVSELSLVECAALAAIVKNPSQYEPKYHDEDRIVTVNGEEILREGNKSRRWDVLWCMWEKCGFITEAEYNAAIEEELVIVSHNEEEEEKLGEGMTLYSWYTESLITQLTYDFMELYGIEYTAASQMVFNSGLKIVIPMDPKVQDTLEMVYENDAEYFPSTGKGLQPQSACVVTDPNTNDVLGIVGGRGEKTINRGTNRASSSKRPPGSSIKPLSVYAPALEAGIITYGSVVDDTPVMFNEDVLVEATDTTEAVIEYTPYPQNYPVVYKGLTTINSAVTRSVNTVAMKVLQMIGVDYSFDFMKNELGFDSLIDSVTKSNGEILTDRGLAALALGQPNYGVTLLEMTSAYSIFPNNGIYSEPKLYLYVKDADGKTLIDKTNEDVNIVISEETASIMTIMLQKVMNEGTGTAATIRNSVDTAGKTGTTSADFDRYFVGYTPYYVCGVWTGYDMNQSLSSFVQNPSLAVRDKIMNILHEDIIAQAAEGTASLKTFETAPGVVQATYCKDSGLLCTDACALDPRGYRAETGYFTRESVPTDYCDTHVVVLRDTSTGLIASDDCNPANCQSVALIRVEDRSFPVQIFVEDAQYVYREMPDDVKPGGWWGDPFFINMLREGEFCGTSYAETPYNAYCYKHCDYRPWGGNPPAEYSGYTPPDKETSVDTDNIPDESSPDDNFSEDDIYDDEAYDDKDSDEENLDLWGEEDDDFWNNWFSRLN